MLDKTQIPMYTKQALRNAHEWLSGGVSPCQGEGRGFESRLVLFFILAEALILLGFRVFGCRVILTTVDDS